MAGGGHCVSPPGGDQGITPSQVKVAVTLINIVGPAGNATFGVPPPAEQQADYQEVIDAVNAAGGVVCRKLVPLFYPVNNADSGDQQQKCLDIVQAGVFAVLDAGGYFESSALNCFPQNHIPFVAAGFITANQHDQFYPYLFGRGLFDTLYKNTAFGLRARGFYGGGFRKLGFVYRSCFPELVSQYFGWLHQIGLSSGQIVGYDLGCPSAFATPSDLEQAILKFQQAGVTNVTGLGVYADFSNFTNIAEQQGFRPRYGMPDDGVFGVSYGNQHPDYNNIANALLITADRLGEERTPGMAPGPATARCDAIYKAAGRPPTWQQYISGGQACDNVWMLAAALAHSSTLQRSTLAAGLQASRSVDFSYPYGPNDFGAPGSTVGDEFWRPLQFFSSCSCWRVVDPAFHSSF